MYGNWRHAYQTVEEHEGDLYIVWHDYRADEPVEYRSWYATGIPARGQEWIGQRVQRTDHGYIVQLEHTKVRILLDGSALPTHQTEIPIPCPKQRGRAYPTHYKNGYWYRETPKRGFVCLG